MKAALLVVTPALRVHCRIQTARERCFTHIFRFTFIAAHRYSKKQHAQSKDGRILRASTVHLGALMSIRSEYEADVTAGMPALQRLPVDEARDLFNLIRAASTFEAATLDKAIDSMVGALPRALRGVAKRIMFGGR
ncbi:hypothetical protein ACFO5K_12380 [Nocardia halotolerans]|uniref:Uncharacterized protein n=1 Tax=Nocardia halotolerans TaxID=1755878 RepID=A0ABV8VJ66_9NOCA